MRILLLQMFSSTRRKGEREEGVGTEEREQQKDVSEVGWLLAVWTHRGVFMTCTFKVLRGRLPAVMVRMPCHGITEETNTRPNDEWPHSPKAPWEVKNTKRKVNTKSQNHTIWYVYPQINNSCDHAERNIFLPHVPLISSYISRYWDFVSCMATMKYKMWVCW